MADTNVQILADRKDIVAVADAVRAKTGTTAALTLGGMVTAIEDINVGSDPVLQDKTVTPTTSKQTITADSGYDGLDTVTVNAMPTATQATPSISVNSSGLITASATQTAGYVAAGTKSATKQLTTQAAKTITPSTSSQTAVASGRYTTGAVTVAAIPSTYVKPTATKAAATYTPGTSNQTIAAGTYLSGAQTIKGDANLKAANIAEGVSIFGVTGTHSGGSGGASGFPNGTEWTQSNITTGTFSCIYNANGIWLAGESSNDLGFYYSTDGKMWSKGSFANGSTQFGTVYDFSYIGNTYVMAEQRQGLTYSTDGKTWTQSNITSSNIRSICNANGILLAGGSPGLYYSTDGKTWTQSNITSGGFNCIYNANGIWVAATSTGLYYSVSWEHTT